MSTRRTGFPFHCHSMLIESRVIPASGPVIMRSSPSIRLTRVDLPALGRPTIARLSGALFLRLFVPGLEMLMLDVWKERLEQVCDAFAVLGAERDRFAQPKPIGFERPAFTRPPFGLVGDHDHRRGRDPQPARDLFVHWGQALARVDHEQRRVGFAHRGLGLLAHAARQAGRVLVLEPGGVDHPELQPNQVGVAFAPVARDSGPVIDQREALADEPVEERRFADVGAADDCNGGERHGGRLVEQARHCERSEAIQLLDCRVAFGSSQ